MMPETKLFVVDKICHLTATSSQFVEDFRHPNLLRTTRTPIKSCTIAIVTADDASYTMSHTTDLR